MRQLCLRKFSPIDREFPIYEILDGDQQIVDVTRSNAGEYEISFHETSVGRVLPLLPLIALITEAQELLSNG